MSSLVSDLKMYYVFELDGDKHLIQKDFYNSFSKAVARVVESYEEHEYEDVYYEELDDLLSHFSKGCLEGEEYFVVLASDLKEGK